MLPFLKARIGGADIDMMPNPFAFPTAGGQAPNVLVSSAVVQITGISVPVPVTVNVGQFRVLDATQTIVIQDWSTVGSIKKGQCLQLRQTSSNAYSGTVSMGVNVGKASVVWYVTTVAVSGGSAGWGTPGTYYYPIPYHNSFNFDVYGAGGGGGGCGGVVPVQNYYSGGPGGSGGYSQIYDEETGGGKVNVIGWAGGGGSGMQYTGSDYVYGDGGAGSGQGGDGIVPGGGAGGGASSVMYPDYAPSFRYYGGNGGPGGRAYRGVARGLLTPGTRLVIIVGQGGAPGGDSPDQGYIRQGAGWGGNGASYISWG
ncbi:hypothetical protein [Tardiphaga sp. 709]|uniref:hypothetical protein n=1 Tax=Tardiphaga sp. 709 TaxID=3076039 RepID=UPI0028F00155|nr:hypothetical protein [Tardiphaga sp. 709]WNV10091.1 hypothetical protein RSO67_02525 [Tardiphaga sp. 709]